MAKRFTESTKWRDSWFMALPPEFKLAWLYVCDECDHAGILELNERLANLQIGIEIDWQAFLAQCGRRVEYIKESKYWVRTFCEFQHGKLNPGNRVHKSVIRRLESLKLVSVERQCDKDLARSVPKVLDGLESRSGS
ncbi:MAG: hypothetical protein R3C28_04445 [Pirellulaceae bacterium]